MILVTGAKGYIGTAVCHHLRKLGHQVLGIDNYSNSCFTNLSAVEHIDVTNLAEMLTLFQNNPIRAVIHLAAHKYAKPFEQHNLRAARMQQDNVMGMHNVLTCMARYGVKRLVFAGTNDTVRHYDTKVPTNLPSGSSYAFSKTLCENLIHRFSMEYSIQSTVMKLNNVIGTDEESNAGDKPYNGLWANLLPTIDEVIKGRARELIIAPHNVRDYDSLMDVVNMAISEVLNVNFEVNASGSFKRRALKYDYNRSYSVNEIVDAVNTLLGREIPIAYFGQTGKVVQTSRCLDVENEFPIAEQSVWQDISNQLQYYRELDERTKGTSYKDLKKYEDL